MDSNSDARLQHVYPPLAEKVRRMASMLAGEGIDIRVCQALRTFAEQEALYAQGRTVPGRIVTNCRGGHSYHNFGLAVDCVPDDQTKAGFQCDWNAKHPAWKRMEAVGQSLGLEVGAYWRSFPDAPHFQLTGRFPVGAPPDELRQLAENGDLQPVWDEVTRSMS